jgi:hypothetical protein
MMTLNRYLLVGKDHTPWLVAIAKLEFKWVIRGSLLFSILINIGHGWEYKAVNDLILTHFYITSYATYVQVNGYSYSDYPLANQGTPYSIYSILYFFINFGAFFILNTSTEVNMVRRMQKELKEKRQRLAVMNTAKSLSLSAEARTTQTDQNKKREEDDCKKERRVIKMVVLNSIFNFVLRVPDMLFWMENMNIWSVVFKITYGSTNQNTPGILNLIVDVGYFSYILTFCSNFIIYYKFNKNFKEAVEFYRSS